MAWFMNTVSSTHIREFTTFYELMQYISFQNSTYTKRSIFVIPYANDDVNIQFSSPDQLPKSATLPKWAMLCLIRQHEFWKLFQIQ